MKYFSMFTGVGGFELGFPKEWECVGVSEIDKYCSQLLNNKFKGVKNYGDATSIKTNNLPDFDILCGGFPCQAFSVAGKRRGFKDTRGTLFFEIARILEAKRPTYFLLENVKGLLNHEEGKTFGKIIQTISELGYEFQWMVLNSKFFGVPQNRERVFIIGNIRGTSKPKILPFRKIIKKINGEYKETRQIIQVDDVARENKYKFGDRLKMDGAAFTLNSIEQRGIIYPTLSTELAHSTGRDFFRNGGIKIFKASNHIRRLTPTECERLQGFPDNWTKELSDTQRFKAMGNAVTVNVIKALGIKLKNQKI